MLTTLTPQQREQVRYSLLRYGLGYMTTGLAHQYLVSEGHRGIAREQVQQEINYLCDPEKGLMRENTKLVSPEMATYSTTALGRDLLAEAGLE
jgi:hypothetical protein